MERVAGELRWHFAPRPKPIFRACARSALPCARTRCAIRGFSAATLDGHRIWALFVEPGHEGRGIGRRLLNEAVAWLRQQGATCVTLTTRPGTRAERVYRQAGWLSDGVRVNGELVFTIEP